MYRIDADDAHTREVCFAPGSDVLTIDGFTVRPVISWVRHFQTSGIMVMDDPLLAAYTRGQWQAAYDVLSNWPVKRQINGGDCRTLDRVRQLATAQWVDVPTPQTCIATTAGAAADMLAIPMCDLIAKPLGEHFVETSAGHVVGAFARRLGDDPSADIPQPAPVMFQQYVRHSHELRVFLIGDQVYSFQVLKASARQLWSDAQSVQVQRCETPPQVHHYVKRLNEHFRLELAAFDFLVTDDDHIFLEVNVAGDWAFFEHAAQDGSVSTSVRLMLRNLYRELA